MRYALFTLNDKQFIVDAHEYSALNTFEDSIKDVEPKPDENGPLYVAYGVYKPQPGIEWQDAMGHLLERQDVWLGHIEGEHCHPLGFHAVQPLPPVPHGESFSIPFAALIHAHPELIERIGDHDSSQAVTAFVRFWDITPAHNIFERKGLLAFKGIERRGTTAVTKENWGEHIDIERLVRTALRIH
ncbi:TPA: hypothetical protein QDB15_000053 [Burkholderia vietnamiensis]|uniref:Uncharacterized protein n=1 Tax=Pandoraea apista TaxID=93218 RepID=A0A5E5P1H2_9BURK|nr:MULTISPECIES: hypothetical protein [Burkholderiaceae]MCA8206327.1 hypothetical protein [Burkholderia vietnamiensis]VVG70402.1 hypothetical protein PAP18089_01362 [Pandoraea apista]HDR8943125.1 hypothetical protein [Burkholderia vietnamiensis]HDR9116329.1 hypothetical protein [Burkholderia vietnamiensis]HDR9205375.1 hypothetical protein [Burkholderia vietnamiensis]